MATPITEAEGRVLLKARTGVRRVGAYSGKVDPHTWMEPDFDRARLIDQLVGKGLLTAGEAFNVYVPTEAGWKRISKKKNVG